MTGGVHVDDDDEDDVDDNVGSECVEVVPGEAIDDDGDVDDDVATCLRLLGAAAAAEALV